MNISATVEDWVAYENLDFGNKSLGEVVEMLNCLQTDSAEPAFPSDMEQVSKKQLIARWHNTTSIARMKHLV